MNWNPNEVRIWYGWHSYSLQDWARLVIEILGDDQEESGSQDR